LLPSIIMWYNASVAKINAARNIRNCYTAGGGPSSTGPEALPGLPGGGRPPTLAVG